MSFKVYRPNAAGRRAMSVDTFDDITKFEPEKALTYIKKSSGGRAHGKISVRHRGGGEKRYIRIVDFRRDTFDVPATVRAIEYDPNRGARLMLLAYANGERRYSIAPEAVSVGRTIVSSRGVLPAEVGNRMPLKFIPVGLLVHDIELVPGKGGQMVRSAGGAAELQAVEMGYALLKLSSGEIRKVPEGCSATVGRVSNSDRRLIRWGKAGRMRHRGIRPTVRGKAMNPVDHPHGGGEGKNPVGLVHPKTKWGKPALGVKTRKSHKWSNKFIVRRRT